MSESCVVFFVFSLFFGAVLCGLFGCFISLSVFLLNKIGIIIPTS